VLLGSERTSLWMPVRQAAPASRAKCAPTRAAPPHLPRRSPPLARANPKPCRSAGRPSLKRDAGAHIGKEPGRRGPPIRHGASERLRFPCDLPFSTVDKLQVAKNPINLRQLGRDSVVHGDQGIYIEMERIAGDRSADVLCADAEGLRLAAQAKLEHLARHDRFEAVDAEADCLAPVQVDAAERKYQVRQAVDQAGKAASGRSNRAQDDAGRSVISRRYSAIASAAPIPATRSRHRLLSVSVHGRMRPSAST